MTKPVALQELATATFSQGYNCAQSVLLAFAEKLALEPDLALRMSTGFGAGMGRQQEVCGAVSGGILALSLRHGRGEADPKEKTEQTYLLTRKLIADFEQRHGSCRCKNILNGCDLKTPEGQALFKEQGLVNAVCKPCVRTVVELVDPLLQ